VRRDEANVIIELADIEKTYHAGEVAVPVLRGIDLEIDAGEYVALIGRSGAGKSTLMNIIGCLDQPTSGSYSLDGVDVSRLEDDNLSAVRGRTVGFVFQSFHLLPGRNVTENVELPMEYQRVPPEQRHARARTLLERVGLGHRLDHFPRQLSGGERQRVAIARALANKPRLLLADEPTGNLDSAARDRILKLFEELVEDEDLTLVMVTHDDEISDRARRCVTLSDGRVVDDRVRP
jgi:putative ABC transport system ATP-binding protein